MPRTPPAAVGVRVIFLCIKTEEIVFYLNFRSQVIFKVLSCHRFLRLEVQVFDQLEYSQISRRRKHAQSSPHSCVLSKRFDAEVSASEQVDV